MALRPRTLETAAWAAAVGDALTRKQEQVVADAQRGRRNRRVIEREAVDELCQHIQGLEPLRAYLWFDGIDIPRTGAEFDAFVAALPPADLAAFRTVWERARQSLTTPAPAISFTTRPDEAVYAAQIAAAAPGNRPCPTPLGNRGRRGGPMQMQDEVFDAPRIQGGRFAMVDYNFLYPDMLEFISDHTTNLHEFLRVNRVLSRWGGKALSESMGFNSNAMLEYENRGQHPKHDTLRQLQNILFMDNDAGKRKTLQLEDLVIRDKVTAGNYCVEDGNYLGYIQHTKDLPRAFWHATLSAFCFPQEWHARANQPSWSDVLLKPGSQGEFVRAIRLHLNMRQTDLADIINRREPVGLSRSLISHIENDRTLALNEHQYMALLRFFDEQNAIARANGQDPFFDMALARQRFNEWAQRAEGIADGNRRGRDEEDEVPYPEDAPRIPLGAAAPAQDQPRPQVQAGTIHINTNAETLGDSPCIPARHALFLNHPRNASYEGMDTQNLPTIATETRNFHEFVTVSRLQKPNASRAANLPEGLKQTDLRNIEMKGAFPSLEKFALLSRWLFPDDSPNMEANRAKLEQLFIENKVAIAAGAMAAERNNSVENNLKHLPKAYWDQVFLRFQHPDQWAAQPNPPAWRDAVMEITSRGLYVKAFRLAHDMTSGAFGQACGAKNLLSYVENDADTHPGNDAAYRDRILPKIAEMDAADVAQGKPSRYEDSYRDLDPVRTRSPWPRTAYRLPYGAQDPDLPE